MPRKSKTVLTRYARPEIKEVSYSPWYIGIDQSSTNNGVAAYNKDTQTIYTTNFFCGKHQVELVERIYRLERFLESLVSQLRPQHVYTEDVHPGNRHAYAVLLRVEMAIHSLLYRTYTPYSSISANSVQKNSWPSHLKIKGTKEHIRLALYNIADPLSTEHELDAIGVLLGSLVRDKLFELELIKELKITHIQDFNEYTSILGCDPS